VNELPASILSNEHARAATLLINRSVFVLPLGSGAIAHDGGISEKRTLMSSATSESKSTLAVLAIFQELQPAFDVSVRR
jgi:hypothetical protein